MYPKPLRDLCIDKVVDATVLYQLRQHHPETLFKAVRAVWRELWGLCQVHQEAVSLLHARALRTYRSGPSISRFTCHRDFVIQVKNIYPPVITLLAARATEINFESGLVHLNKADLDLIGQCGIFSEINQLHKIDTTYIDLAHETRFLERLLPCCHKLTVLMVDSNGTHEVLHAAKQCPLKVLHVSERLTCYPRVDENVLSEVVLGIQGRPKTILNTYVKGGDVTFKPSWPNLINFSSGLCIVSKEFLVLALIALRRLEYLQSIIIPISSVIKLYVSLFQNMPSLPRLGLKANSMMYEDFWQLYTHYPKLERVTLLLTDSEKDSLTRLFELGHLLPHVKMICLSHGTTLQPFTIPKDDKFRKFVRQITILELNNVAARLFDSLWIKELLQQFPCLQTLYLNGNLQVYPEPVEHPVTLFETVTDLQCMCDNNTETFLYFLLAFPNLVTLTLTASNGEISLPWERLAELRKLRCLSLFACKVLYMSDLCKVPWERADQTKWELHVAPRHLTKSLVSRLHRAGWTWVPVSDI